MTSYFDTFHAVASFFLSKLHEKLPSFFSIISVLINTLSASFTKWSNTLKQFVAKLETNCLSVFDHFVVSALKGLNC